MTRKRVATGVYKSSPGVYLLEVPVGKDPTTGKYRPYTETFHGTKDDAVARRAELVVQKSKGRLVRRTSPLTFGEYLTQYMAKRKRGLADRTAERYDSLARTSLTPALGSVPLAKLTEAHIEAFLAGCDDEASTRNKGKKVAAKTVHNRFLLLRMVLDAAWEDGLIPANPARKSRIREQLPKVSRYEGRTLSLDEAKVLQAHADGTELELIVYLATHTGARLGEILALRRQDVRLDQGTVLIRQTLVEHLRKKDGPQWWDFKEPKSKSSRRDVDVDAETAERLREHLRGPHVQLLGLDLLFTHGRGYKSAAAGEPYRPTSISRAFRRIATDAGFPTLRFHDLRHHHATVLRDQGWSERDIGERLGHSDAATTSRLYGHTPDGRKRQIAEAYGDAYEGKRAVV